MIIISKRFVLSAFFPIAANAIDWFSFPDPLHKNSVLISPSFEMLFLYPNNDSNIKSEQAPGGGIAVDYALPINFPLVIEIEAGYYHSLWDNTFPYAVYLPLDIIPISLRLSWHPNLQVKGLDTYLLGKAGFNVWLWDNSSPKSSRHYSTGYGHVLGIDACIRYFFSEKFGIFAETGYERYYGYFSAEYNWAYPTPAVWSDYIDIVALYEKFFFCRLYS